MVLPDGPLGDETHPGPFIQSLLVSVPVLALYAKTFYDWFGRHKQKKIRKEATAWVVCSLLFIVGGGAMMHLCLNMALDRSPAVEYRAVVIGKYETRVMRPRSTPSAGWRLVLASWRPGHRVKLLGVDKENFERVTPNRDRAVVLVHPGFLGFPWIESARIETPA